VIDNQRAAWPWKKFPQTNRSDRCVPRVAILRPYLEGKILQRRVLQPALELGNPLMLLHQLKFRDA